MSYPFKQLAVVDEQRPRWWRRLRRGGASLLRRPEKPSDKRTLPSFQKTPIALASSMSKIRSLQFEPLEPRLLLSADPLSTAAASDTTDYSASEPANELVITDTESGDEMVAVDVRVLPAVPASTLASMVKIWDSAEAMSPTLQIPVTWSKLPWLKVADCIFRPVGRF